MSRKVNSFSRHPDRPAIVQRDITISSMHIYLRENSACSKAKYTQGSFICRWLAQPSDLFRCQVENYDGLRLETDFIKERSCPSTSRCVADRQTSDTGDTRNFYWSFSRSDLSRIVDRNLYFGNVLLYLLWVWILRLSWNCSALDL